MSGSGEKNPHVGHRKRLRQRFAEVGLRGFSQHEAIELVLTLVIPRKDVNPLAHALIDRFGTVYGVLHASEEELRQVRGMGEKSAHFLNVLQRSIEHLEREATASRIPLGNNYEFRVFLKAFFKNHPTGTIWQFNLDLNDRLLCSEPICAHGENVLDYRPKIIRSALECGAKSILFASKVDYLDQHCRTSVYWLSEIRSGMEMIGVGVLRFAVLVREDIHFVTADRIPEKEYDPYMSGYEMSFWEEPSKSEENS